MTTLSTRAPIADDDVIAGRFDPTATAEVCRAAVPVANPAAPLKAPFPAFGGKSQVADLVWSRFGNPRNYVEPFVFSYAMGLRRPTPGPIETINDLNSYVSNFWRAVQADPEAVARHADWIVSEDDLHARHRWLVMSDEAVNKLARVRAEPDYYDAKIAGWWAWGACMWIGGGWCDDTSTKWSTTDSMHVTMEACRGGGKGVNGVGSFAIDVKRPRLAAHTGGGKSGDQPGDPGTLIHSGRPAITDAYSRGRGVNGNDSASVCDDRRAWLVDWMRRLADRLRPVRVCCGHWSRVCDSDSTLTRLGPTAVFLDAPYRKTLADGSVNRTSHLYANDKHQDVNALVDEVQGWGLKWDGDPNLRIAVCGLEGEYPKLDAAGWEKVAWKSRGGYGNRTDAGKANAARERIWFNRSCLAAAVTSQGSLFTGGAA